MRENRWELSKEDLERIAADIWPKSKSDAITMLKGTAIKPPPVPHQARRALDKIGEHLVDVDSELDRLSEPALKGLVYQARKDCGDDPLILGVAAVAERKLEILKRHRTGRGKWFALVKALKWDPFTKSGEMTVLASAKCETRSAAVRTARQLLTEHAAKLDENTEIEGPRDL